MEYRIRLNASHITVKLINNNMVRLEGLEPPQVTPTVPKTVASTNSATAA
jgi:hypothetical protein